MKRHLLVALMIIAFASIAEAQDSVRSAIEANNKKFVEAFNKGDAAAVANMYTSDARLLPPLADVIQDRAEIEKKGRRKLPVPFGVDRRPMPFGTDLNILVPQVVGSFRREPFPPNMKPRSDEDLTLHTNRETILYSSDSASLTRPLTHMKR